MKKFIKLLLNENQIHNADEQTVAGFGDEWTRYDQSELSEEERAEIFEQYFGIFPWHALPDNAEGFDLGSGSGRWAQCVAPRVGVLHCIDASDEALKVAQKNLKNQDNCRFHHARVDAIPLADNSMDFGYSLGVLHHVPDTLGGLKSCVAKLKSGAPFLLYLYYAFDNKPSWYRALWKVSEIGRGFYFTRAARRARCGLHRFGGGRLFSFGARRETAGKNRTQRGKFAACDLS